MRKIILGTDWWTDCDDAVALRLITRAVTANRIKLLGICINACMEHSVASLRGFLEADGVKDIPIGIDLCATEYGGKPPYQKRLAALCPDVTNADAEESVRLYRRLLATATEPVEILEIGFLQVVAALLQSKADDISDKCGLDLVRDKVSHFWIMGGKWDADGEKEHNFSKRPIAREAANLFCRFCPVPVTFLGWEIGDGVITGGELKEEDHLHGVLVDFGSPEGRDSWDPMLVHLALVGDEHAAGYQTITGWASVDADTGANHFAPDTKGLHCYVIKQKENDTYKQEIDQIIS